MPTIVDPDNLLDAATDSAQNVFINTAVRNIIVRNNSAAPSGPTLDETGVTGQALYSFLKEQWKDDPKGKNLISYPFPMIAITPEQFEFRYGWKPDSDVSRSLIRTAGWREYLADNTSLEKQFMGTITLGNIDGEQTGTPGAGQDLAYYVFSDPTNRLPVAPTDSVTGPIVFDYPGPVNQAVKVYDAGNLTDGAAQDNRTDIMTVYIRTEAKTYDQTRTTDIGISAGTALPYNVQRFPLAEGTDLDVTVSDSALEDATLGTTTDGAGNVTTAIATKYDSAKINYLASAVLSDTLGYTQDLTGGPYPFGITIDATSPDVNGALRKNELYSWVQYRLRKTPDSDVPGDLAGIQLGRLQDELLEFVGPTLKTKTSVNPGGAGNGNAEKASGAAIINFFPSDINDLAFRSDSAVTTTGLADRIFPFTANYTLSFSDTIATDSVNAAFSVYFTYTRRSPSVSTTITNAGTAAAFPAGYEEIDSATFTGSFPVVYVGGDPTDPNAGDYIKVSGATNPDNNQVYKVTDVITPSASAFSVISYDNLTITNEGPTSIDLDEHPINSPDALLVDSSGTVTPDTGGVTGTLQPGATQTFSYDYDGNTQGNRAGSTNAPITIRAIGLDNGAYVEVAATIERLASQTFSVVSALERNYSNP